MPKITCILPAYRVAPYLAAAVNSLLAQTERDFEVLILDDGSRDETLAVAEACTRDARVRLLVNEQNIGLAATLNRGIAASDSRYIARMDADDICLPQRFARQLAYMEQHPQVGLCGARRIDCYPDGTRKRGRIHTDPAYIKAALFWDTVIAHPTFFIDRARLLASGQLYDPACRAAEDYDLLCRLRPFFDFGNVAKPLLLYTVRADSLSRAADSPADALIARIRQRNLDALLGGAASAAEHHLNHQLRHAQPIANADALAAFLDRLMAANAVRQIYPAHAFAGVLAEKCARLIKRQRAGHLAPVYRAFCRQYAVRIPLRMWAQLAVLARG
jgi:glycosyltransferase involved in cell wall biosynthesis